MKLTAIALDYDGTIATDAGVAAGVREAVAAARADGVVTLLVTGRILTELHRVAGSLQFVDGVVAENGAVVHFTDTGHTTLLAPPIPEAFLDELQRRGVAHQAGQCLVDADARVAPALLAVIRELELPLVLLFNKGRVMTLPQGISKATGLRITLDTLRLSARNTLAIGDAENDHELLRLAEVGAAVEWGSPALRRAADVVIPGQGPEAVAKYVRAAVATGMLPVPARARRHLRLGVTADGAEFSLAVRGRNVLVAGDAHSGKSWIVGLLCEQLILHGYCVCVFDPEGDYGALEALPGVAVLGGAALPPAPGELLGALRYPDRSIVVDLSRLPHDEKIEYIRSALPAVNALRRRTGLPHRIVLDEAHYFLHDADHDTHHDAAPARLLDFDRNGYIVATYWASRLPPQFLAHTEVMIVARESNPSEIDALRRLCGRCTGVDEGRWGLLPHLQLGQAVALPVTDEAGGDLRPFTIGPRLTPHVRHREKYLDVPVADRHAFHFGGDTAHTARRARTLREFVAVLESDPPEALRGYLERGDFSRWIEDVFGDGVLARDLRRLERRYQESPSTEVIADMVAAVRSRYDLPAEAT